MKLDEDEEKDKLKKKMIACIKIGLLETSSNTAKKSIACSKMVDADAFYYQEKYGGSINIISEIEYGKSVAGYTTVCDSDEEEEVEVYNSGAKGEEKHYVLNTSDTKT